LDHGDSGLVASEDRGTCAAATARDQAIGAQYAVSLFESAMDYRSLLVHIDDSDQSDLRLDVAARLARKLDAELAGAYLVPTRELTPFTSAMLPDAMVQHRLHESGDAQARAEVRFRVAAEREGLMAVDWSAAAGPPIDAAISHARYSDVEGSTGIRAGRRRRIAVPRAGAQGRRRVDLGAA